MVCSLYGFSMAYKAFPNKAVAEKWCWGRIDKKLESKVSHTLRARCGSSPFPVIRNQLPIQVAKIMSAGEM